jgi:probable F420-dependent oxidoreductase
MTESSKVTTQAPGGHPHALTCRRLGLELPESLPIFEKVELARWADKHDYSDVWVPEITDSDVFVTLALVAQATSRLRIGTAIVPIGTRSVPLLAASTASMIEISNGRFVLGLGVSSPAITEDWHGLGRSRPLGRSRETVELLRHLLAGQRSDHHGEWVRSKGFYLRNPPTRPALIMLAAMNPMMLELAGEIADGVLLNMVPVERVGAAIEAIRRGSERVGRAELPELILELVTEVNDDEEAAMTRFAHDIAYYLAVPPYQKALAWHGFEDDVERAKRGWATGNIERVRAGISPEFVSSIGAFGSYEKCRKRYEQYWAAGINTLTPTTLRADPRATYECFAELARAVRGNNQSF